MITLSKVTMEIGLVSCTKQKREQPSTPANLYAPSAYFRKMRDYCEENHKRWYVLSAKHGLLEPDGESIEPYDETLRDASIDEKRVWADEVFEQLQTQEQLDENTIFVIHAGRDYYSELLPLLDDTNVTVEIPTEGLGLGEKMAWYNDRIE